MKNERNLVTRIGKLTKFKTLMIISGVLLVLALIGMSVMLSKPAKIKQQTALISYTQNSQFAYTAFLKPSYLYGPTPQAMVAVSQFPQAVVGTIAFTYSFQPTVAGSSGTAWVEAVLENPGIWQKTLELVPSTPTNGDFTLDFSLDMQQINQLFTEIEKETGISPTSQDMTLNAYFQSGSDVTVQSLPITIENNLIEISNSLSLLQGAGSGQFAYNINSVVPAIQTTTVQGTQTTTASYPSFNLTGQPVVTTTSAPVVLQPGETAFVNLINNMDVNFGYEFQATKPVNNLNTNVDIVATLSVPQSWSKNFDLLQTTKSGDFTVDFPLDIASYTQLMQSINSETGTTPSSYNLTVTANIHTTGDSSFGPIDETFNPTMNGTITGNILTWDKDLTGSKTGAINQTATINNPSKYLGLSVSAAKMVFVILATLFFFLFVGLAVLYFGSRRPNHSAYDREVQKIQKRYGARIAESLGNYFIDDGKPVPMNSIDDLIKVADELGRPLVHQSAGASGEVQLYYVIDGETRYQYSVFGDKPNQEVKSRLAADTMEP
jgi:hypothetical protein